MDRQYSIVSANYFWTLDRTNLRLGILFVSHLLRSNFEHFWSFHAFVINKILADLPDSRYMYRIRMRGTIRAVNGIDREIFRQEQINRGRFNDL